MYFQHHLFYSSCRICKLEDVAFNVEIDKNCNIDKIINKKIQALEELVDYRNYIEKLNKDKNFQAWLELDDIVNKFFDGQYVENFSNNKVRYNHRKILKYANKIGKKPSELTKEELEKFIVKD